jgi:Preprotein translocase subunit YajC
MTHTGLLPALLALQFGGAAGSLTPFLVQLVAIFAIFYFLLIRRSRRRRRSTRRR